MSDWQPIGTAPKDGTIVDLWMVDEHGKGWREANAFHVTGRDEEVYIYEEQGGHRVERAPRDGWFAPGHDYDGHPGFCDQPVRMYGRPLAPAWKLPTHWMPLPAPPSTSIPSR